MVDDLPSVAGFAPKIFPEAGAGAPAVLEPPKMLAVGAADDGAAGEAETEAPPKIDVEAMRAMIRFIGKMCQCRANYMFSSWKACYDTYSLMYLACKR